MPRRDADPDSDYISSSSISSSSSEDEESSGDDDDEEEEEEDNPKFYTTTTTTTTVVTTTRKKRGRSAAVVVAEEEVQEKKKKKKNQRSSSRRRTTPGVYVLRSIRTGVCYVEIGDLEKMKKKSGMKSESLSTTGSVNDLESWERSEVLTRMFIEGFDRVRGFEYNSKGPLSMGKKRSARDDIMEKFDLCRRCGRDSHFASRCFARSPASWCRGVVVEGF